LDALAVVMARAVARMPQRSKLISEKIWRTYFALTERNSDAKKIGEELASPTGMVGFFAAQADLRRSRLGSVTLGAKLEDGMEGLHAERDLFRRAYRFWRRHIAARSAANTPTFERTSTLPPSADYRIRWTPAPNLDVQRWLPIFSQSDELP
jgi:hypothetical protein